MPTIPTVTPNRDAVRVGPFPGIFREPPPATIVRKPEEVIITGLIQRADKHVSIDGDIAKINPLIKQDLTEDEINKITEIVNLYNSDKALQFRELFKLPIINPGQPMAPSTSSDSTSTSQAINNPPPSPCTPHISVSFQWWGFTLHLDHCFCYLLKSFGGVVGPTANNVSAILAAAGVTGASAGNAWVGLAVGLIAFVWAWIAWADGNCTPNTGANYNQSWTVQGWVTANC
jgi:hypothetical protein